MNAGVTAFQEDMEALKHNFLVRGFFKKRGYEDSEDLTAHTIPKLPQKQVVKEFDLDSEKLFAKPDTAKLKHQKMLNDVGSYLQQNPFEIAVIAASKEKGDTEKVKVLTEARAAVVRQYLAENFKLDDRRVKTIGLGKADQGDRVEVLVYK
jgi:outer membrane protein OmpA-like peptidoglycan-associated protein